jgi:hypothetical protein
LRLPHSWRWSRPIGADHVIDYTRDDIDYTRDDFAHGRHHYDLILDTGGNSRLSQAAPRTHAHRDPGHRRRARGHPPRAGSLISRSQHTQRRIS